MGRTQQWEAVVLKIYDVGEADRYVVLFTRERGRMPVRVHGARKPLSAFTGVFGSGNRVRVTVRESAAGNVAQAAELLMAPATTDLAVFAELAQGLEAVLRLTADDDPLPDVFELLVTFCQMRPTEAPHAATVFGLELLCRLGLLPEAVPYLAPAEAAVLQAVHRRDPIAVSAEASVTGLRRCLVQHMEQHASAPLQAPAVAALLS